MSKSRAPKKKPAACVAPASVAALEAPSTSAEWSLCRFREASRLTQAEVAVRLKIAQNNISRLEARDDMLLSTLRNYLESMGAQLEIRAHINGRAIPLSIAVPQTVFKNPARG